MTPENAGWAGPFTTDERTMTRFKFIRETTCKHDFVDFTVHRLRGTQPQVTANRLIMGNIT